jgi:DNA-binding response OmpR family regulator
MNNILVVDDDRKLRDLLAEYLKNQGLQVDLAESAEKAHEMLKTKNYDLITMDVMMPGENGVEFTRRLKRKRTFRF